MEKGCSRGLPQIWSRAAGEALGGGGGFRRGAGSQGWERAEK